MLICLPTHDVVSLYMKSTSTTHTDWKSKINNVLEQHSLMHVQDIKIVQLVDDRFSELMNVFP